MNKNKLLIMVLVASFATQSVFASSNMCAKTTATVTHESILINLPYKGEGIGGKPQSTSIVQADDNCDWPSFGRTPEGNRVAPDECGLSGDGVRLKWKWEPYIGQITTNLVVENGRIYAGSINGKMYCINEANREKIWDFQTGEQILSTPAISNGKVYFGSNDKKLYCLDTSKGTKIWEYITESFIYTKPNISNGKVYFGSLDHKLYCLDASTGFKVWEFVTGDSIHSSPAISNGRVYFGSDDGKFYCLDTSTGAKAWEYQTSGFIWSSPAISNGRVYFGSNDCKFYCLDTSTGTKAWEYKINKDIQTTAAISNGKVFFGSMDGNLYCLDSMNGKFIWWHITEFSIISSPAILNDYIYFGVYSYNEFCCLNINNGEVVWKYKTGDSIWCSPVISDNKVYFASNDNKLYCLDAGNGKDVWQYLTSSQIWTSPAISNSKVYFGSLDSMFYCLDAETGIKIWEYQSGGQIWSSPAISNRKVYFSSRDFKLYCLDANDGNKLWEFKNDYMSSSSPIINNGNIYFGAGDNKLYCLNAENGKKVWEYQAAELIKSSPAIFNGKVYFGSFDQKLYCLNASTGVKVWEYETGDKIYNSPAIANGKVYFGSDDTKLYCLDAEKGYKVWEFKTGSSYNDYGFVRSTPVIFKDKVYFGSYDTKLYCLDALTGTKFWDFRTANMIESSPSISRGMVYFGSYDTNIYRLDVNNGNISFVFPTLNGILSSPSISNGKIYFGSNDGFFYCLEGEASNEQDINPPIIKLINPPEDNFIIAEPTSQFNLEFKVSDSSGLSEVTINGIPATLNSNGKYFATVPLNQGKNVFLIRAIDNSINKNKAEEFLTINVGSTIEPFEVDIPLPTFKVNPDYNTWFVVNSKEHKFASFQDISFKMPTFNNNFQYKQVTQFNTSTKPGSPDIPMFAMKIKIPEDEEYLSYDIDYSESKIPLNGSFITPAKKQFPLPAGGKPYVLPDEVEYGVKTVKPKPETINSVNKINTIKKPIITGGNPYRWPPELYSKRTNEVVIFIKPAYYSKETNSVVLMNDIKFKLNTKKKTQIMSSCIIKPAFLSIQEPYDMCIISSSEMIGSEDGKMDDFADYAQWKTKNGTRTKCVDINDIYAKYKSQDENFKRLHAFLMDEMKISNIKFALLGGEHEIVPTTMVYAETGPTDIKALIPSDAYYTQVLTDWGDTSNGKYKMIGKNKEKIVFNPELFVGRVPVQTKSELTSFIEKMSNYQEYKPTQSYSQRILLFGRKLTEDSYGGDFLDYEVKDLPNIRQNYIRLYDRQPQFGKGEYIYYAGNDFAADVISQRNPHIIAINCHGSTTSFDSFGMDEVDRIKNTVPGYIMTSISCNVNQYCNGVLFDEKNNDTIIQADPCISEKLLFKTNGGALTYSGNSAYGWFCPGFPENSISSIYQKSFLNELFKIDENNHNPPVGQAFWESKALCYGSTDSGYFNSYNWWTYNAYNLLGDPSFQPKFPIVSDKINKLVLSPDVSEFDNIHAFTLKALCNDEQVTISDPENIEWILYPKNNGKIFPLGDSCNVEYYNPGKRGVVFALYKGLQAFAVIEPSYDSYRISIKPEKTVVKLGDEVHFSAKILDSEDIEVNKGFIISWEVDKPEFGIIDQDGVFVPKKIGKCKILATCKELKIGWWAEVEMQ